MILFWNRKLARLNRSLKIAQIAADEANRSKSDFFANMSHELRTPLNVILGFSQLLTHSSNLSSEQLASLQTIGRSGEHLLALINDVLEFSKIEAGKIEVKSERFDLHGFLLGLEEMFRLRAGQKGLALKFILEDDVPTQIRADKNKIRQVLINLLGNAVKFTDTGSITLQVQCREQKQEPSGRSLLRFEVADTGVGISSEDKDKIFDAFFQTGGDRSPLKGTGLGLTISHKFVELMGSKLEVESAVCRGTRFSFDLPVEQVDAVDMQAGRPKGRVIGLADVRQDHRLLVAEDDPENRLLLVTLLKSVGFHVREAVTGQEAVEIWRQWQPHLIWMDIRMPEMDGLCAIREIRCLPGGEKAVIIGLTAFAFEEDRRKILENGGDDYVRKPYMEEDIFNQLEKHLGVRFQYAEIESPPPGDEGACFPDRREIAAMLDALPNEMLSRFDEAIRLSDVDGIEKGIEEIDGINPRLGRFLKKLADVFAYDEIVRCLDDDETG
jgi:CheY-like chemotaxis protein/nitrogen-specific signal transduction histidine kinase